jgi:hypothetical protein
MPGTEKARSLLEERALDCRRRAEQFRAVGEALGNPKTRAVLLDLANDSDKMAAKNEQQIKLLGAA